MPHSGAKAFVSSGAACGEAHCAALRVLRTATTSATAGYGHIWPRAASFLLSDLIQGRKSGRIVLGCGHPKRPIARSLIGDGRAADAPPALPQKISLWNSARARA